MTTFSEFYGHGYETSSIPLTIVDVLEHDVWPVDDNCETGVGGKDQLAVGLHPVIAVGATRAILDGRPKNITGVVIGFTPGLTTATGRVSINIADGYIVKNYVSNIKTYDGVAGAANGWEAAPVIGQPIYVDDSTHLGAGCTLSMSPLNNGDPAQVRNPVAGVLWYCQDEYVDSAQGGSGTATGFPLSWTSDANAEYLVCILLANGWRELA